MKQILKRFFFVNSAASCHKKGAAQNDSKQMTITSMFTKIPNKRETDEGLALESGLHEEERDVKELIVAQVSIGQEKTEDADTEMHFEKKVKLQEDDSKPEKLVFISNSFSTYWNFLSFGKLNAFCPDRLNCQVVFSAACSIS
jgi:hypothetical protein